MFLFGMVTGGCLAILGCATLFIWMGRQAGPPPELTANIRTYTVVPTGELFMVVMVERSSSSTICTVTTAESATRLASILNTYEKGKSK